MRKSLKYFLNGEKRYYFYLIKRKLLKRSKDLARGLYGIFGSWWSWLVARPWGKQVVVHA